MNNLIKVINETLGLESGMDDFGPELYAGSEVAEELLALDDIDNMVEGLESTSTSILGFALVNQEAALESAGLTINEYDRYSDSLGTEAIVNMVKRGGYNVIIAVKKLLSKVWKFLTSIVDFFMINDGRWKSYSKLAKKYRGKLNRLSVHSGEDERDKEYSIRDVETAATFVDGFITAIRNFRPENFTADPTSNDTDAQQLADFALRQYTTLVGAVSTALNTAGGAGTNLSALGPNARRAAGGAGTNTGSGTTVNLEGMKDRIDEFKDVVKERVETIREANDHSIEEAKRLIQRALITIEGATRRDVKWFRQWKKMDKMVDRAIEKLGNERADATTPAATRDSLLTELGVASQSLLEFKKMINIVMKEVGSAIQMILADAAKVISGETHIGDAVRK
jgi:hypothetical protein